jgi:uncharacterized protein (DUF433 family)
VLDFGAQCRYFPLMVGNTFEAIATPLIRDTDGVVRVGGTRVPLESVVLAFGNGSTAEEIAQQFPSLALADVYTAISFILNNPETVEKYCRSRQSERDSVKSSSEARFEPSGIRERLLNRRSQG